MNTTTTTGSVARRLARAIPVLAATAAIGLGAATPANAAVLGYVTTTAYVGGGTTVNIRSTPQIATGNVAYVVGTGYGLSIECQLVGGMLGFSAYSGNRTWNKLSNGRYVHDAVTSTPGGARTYLADGGYVAYSPNIPRCGAAVSTRESRAVDFARSQLGVSYTNLTPDGMWSGWCELFAERAYGTSGRYASAIANYNAQRAVGLIRTDANPPAGALVFYSWGSYGHVGVSLGGGQVISTQGFSSPLPVRQHSVTGVGLPYLGWAYAPGSWPGR